MNFLRCGQAVVEGKVGEGVVVVDGEGVGAVFEGELATDEGFLISLEGT